MDTMGDICGGKDKGEGIEMLRVGYPNKELFM